MLSGVKLTAVQVLAILGLSAYLVIVYPQTWPVVGIIWAFTVARIVITLRSQH